MGKELRKCITESLCDEQGETNKWVPVIKENKKEEKKNH
jgi:hypothetical protein